MRQVGLCVLCTHRIGTQHGNTVKTIKSSSVLPITTIIVSIVSTLVAIGVIAILLFVLVHRRKKRNTEEMSSLNLLIPGIMIHFQ